MIRIVAIVCLFWSLAAMIGWTYTWDENTTTKNDQPVELGQVDWNRDWEAAKSESAKSEKPILVLFQEVPG